MNITRHNYEAYFIDYLDGTLNEGLVRELEIFLDENPDLRKELDEFSQMELVPEGTIFAGKEFLKKEISEKTEITPRNFQEFCVAFYEKQLNPRLENKLKEFVYLHPGFEDDFELFSKVYLKPDPSITLPSHTNLKKGKVEFLYPHRLRMIAAAASVVILAGIYFLSRPDQPVQEAVNIAPVQMMKENRSPQKDIKPKFTTGKKDAVKIIPARAHRIITESTVNTDELPVNTMADMNPLQYAPSITPQQLPVDFNISGINFSFSNNDIPEQNIETSAESVLSVKEFALKEFREKVLADVPVKKNHRISFWDIAGIGIKGINKITGSHIRYERKFNSNGDLMAVIVDSKNFGFTKAVKNN